MATPAVRHLRVRPLRLILGSKKPEAKAFKKWVTSVVQPAIRKDGAYVKGEEIAAPTW